MYEQDLATGPVERKLRIVGRPRAGASERLVVLEDLELATAAAAKSVQTHWMPKLRPPNRFPHFISDCPYCPDGEDPEEMHYVGVWSAAGEFAIGEFRPACFGSLAAEAATGGSRGLIVTVSRGKADASERVLRTAGRAQTFPGWPYHTRRELCRVWKIAIKPRLYKEA